MRRTREWPKRLGGAIETARGRCFEWGAFDCGLFLADCALAMTGYDPGAAFRGRYGTAEGATRALCAFSGAPPDRALEATLTKLFGAPRQHPNYAARGDAVLVETELGPAAGVVGLDGSVVHVVAPERGLIDLPRRLAIMAWGVG